MNPADTEHCRRLVAAGRQAEDFLHSKFWLEVLEPMLVQEQEKARNGCVDAASDAVANGWSAERLAMKVALLSGESAAIEIIVAKIGEMITLGEEAAVDLKELEARKK